MVTTRARITRRVRAGAAVLAGGSLAFGLLGLVAPAGSRA